MVGAWGFPQKPRSRLIASGRDRILEAAYTAVQSAWDQGRGHRLDHLRGGRREDDALPQLRVQGRARARVSAAARGALDPGLAPGGGDGARRRRRPGGYWRSSRSSTSGSGVPTSRAARSSTSCSRPRPGERAAGRDDRPSREYPHVRRRSGRRGRGRGCAGVRGPVAHPDEGLDRRRGRGRPAARRTVPGRWARCCSQRHGLDSPCHRLTTAGIDPATALDQLDDLIRNAPPVPLTDQVRIDRERAASWSTASVRRSGTPAGRLGAGRVARVNEVDDLFCDAPRVPLTPQVRVDAGDVARASRRCARTCRAARPVDATAKRRGAQPSSTPIARSRPRFATRRRRGCGSRIVVEPARFLRRSSTSSTARSRGRRRLRPRLVRRRAPASAASRARRGRRFPVGRRDAIGRAGRPEAVDRLAIVLRGAGRSDG